MTILCKWTIDEKKRRIPPSYGTKKVPRDGGIFCMCGEYVINITFEYRVFCKLSSACRCKSSQGKKYLNKESSFTFGGINP